MHYAKRPQKPVPDGPAPEQDEVTGSVDSVVYRNDETGYVVLNLKVEGGTANGAPTAVVAGDDIDAVVHVPTNGMTNGRWVAPSGATSRRFRLLTSFAVRESCSEVADPAGSVQQSVARIGDTPSQLNACSRTGAAVVI